MLGDINHAHAEKYQDENVEAERSDSSAQRPTLLLSHVHEIHTCAKLVAIAKSITDFHFISFYKVINDLWLEGKTIVFMLAANCRKKFNLPTEI